MRNLIVFALCWLICSCLGPLADCHAFQQVESDQAPTKDDKKNDDLVTINSRPRTRFLQLQTDEFDNPVSLQTATARYVLKDDQGEVQFAVSLESVIHIADASYYRGFQKRFERYDVVLFESLLKAEKPESSEGESPSGFQMLQQLSTGTLGLAYEFDEVDFDQKNMLRADLSTKEIAERMLDRGDNGTTLLADLLGHIIQKVNVAGQDDAGTTGDDAETVKRAPFAGFSISILSDPDGIMKIRRAMATALVHSNLLESPLPPSIHQMIIGDRNDRAISVLEIERQQGKRRIAIFFGVGHMADFEKRLLEEYGMELVAVNWRNAWDLRDGAIEGAPLEGLIESTFRDSFKNKLHQFAKGLHDKQQTGKSDDIIESENDEKIRAMENALKALEAKVKEMESQSKEKEDETPDKSSGEDKSDGTP